MCFVVSINEMSQSHRGIFYKRTYAHIVPFTKRTTIAFYVLIKSLRIYITNKPISQWSELNALCPIYACYLYYMLVLIVTYCVQIWKYYPQQNVSGRWSQKGFEVCKSLISCRHVSTHTWCVFAWLSENNKLQQTKLLFCALKFNFTYGH